MTSTLRVGSQSPAVKAMQQQLAKLGHYAVRVDGDYGPLTKKAVASFEKAHGLRADGVADGKMHDALAKAVAPRPLRVGSSGPAVRALQTRLQALGYYKSTIDGRYGRVTKAAVQAFERKHGWNVDGIAGQRLQETAAKEASTVKKPSWQTAPPPPSDYRVVRFRGVKVNVRTRVMIERAESYMKKMGLGKKLSFSQGSYNTSVAASAGTHDGGGALDIRILGYSSKNADKVVKALRMAGFAAWRRGVADPFAPHIHAIAIGDKRAAPLARSQVAEYFRGGDGLVGSRRDIHLTSVGHNIGRPVPNWAK